ncbi:ATP/GTP-binding protein [Desulfoluna butyratoxydans]|uniref:Aaa domain n=1 Tax=Desulfoluna butyratoxydans TaxID=231438 RepID=A0A4U8YGE5_9BACT|nr:ATP-binding protein [Desulfoluna butyratoxydans]VFQ42405.1 aaa domain [Desulfoluna butyratoxydans]
MKIAFTGAHSTGKTTLLHEFSRIYDGKVVSITEVARTIISNGYPLGMDANVDSYINYVNEQLKSEFLYKNVQYDILISDRTILDTVTYAKVNRRLPRPFIPDSLIEMLENVWLLEKENYDLYVYFPIEFGLVNDGVRPEDLEYQKDVDAMALRLLEQHSVNFVRITGNVAARVEQLSKIVKKIGP